MYLILLSHVHMAGRVGFPTANVGMLHLEQPPFCGLTCFLALPSIGRTPTVQKPPCLVTYHYDVIPIESKFLVAAEGTVCLESSLSWPWVRSTCTVHMCPSGRQQGKWLVIIRCRSVSQFKTPHSPLSLPLSLPKVSRTKCCAGQTGIF